MLTSFFRKSKPINFFLVGVLTCLFYGFFNFWESTDAFSWVFLGKKMCLLVVFLSLLFLSNFTLPKNKTESRHTFALFLVAVLTITFPETMTNGPIIGAGFFTVFGLRRTLAMQTRQNLSKKIFEAVFFLGMACLFFPTSVFFMLVVFFGILIYAAGDYKHWLLPFVGVFAVFMVETTFSLLVYDSFFNPLDFFGFVYQNLHIYSEAQLLWPLLVLLFFAVWMLINFFLTLARSTQKEKNSGYLLVVTLVSAVATVFFSPQKTGAELLFVILPVAWIGSAYFQKRSQNGLKEIVLLSLAALSLFFAFCFL